MKNIELLSEIALTFIRLDNFDKQMNRSLDIIGKHLDVSRVYVFLDDEKSTSTSNVYEWCNSGIEPQMGELQDIPYESIPSWKEILTREGRIYSENINELPSDLVEILAQQEIISLIVYPLIIEHQMRGFIGFDECRQHRKWSDVELEILRTISGIISSSMERNLLQERLAQSENNFRNFFDTIDDLFIIGSLTGDILYANDAVSRQSGYTLEELKTLKILELHPADKRDEAAEILTAMFKGERSSCPLELQDKKGSRFPVETRIWMGKWNGEECIFGISKDLSKEQEALQKFTKLFENNPALMAISSVEDNIITDVNTSFLNTLGYERDEVIGKTNRELGLFVVPEQRQSIVELFLQEGHVRDVEVVIRCKGGNLINGLFSGELIDNFGIKSFLTVMVDITEQVRLRQEVEEQRKRFNLALEGTKAGLWDWDMMEDRVIYSPLWKSMLGYNDSEVENSFNGWKNLWHPDDARDIEKAIKDYLEGRTYSYEVIHRLLHKNGEWRWILCRGALLKDEAGKPYRWVGTNLDVTEEKERSNELERFFSVNLDLLCIADTEGNFIKTNKAWEDILGYTSDELDNSKFLDFVHPEDIDATLLTMSRLDGQEKVLNFVNRYRGRDGSYHYIEWRSHPYGKLIYAAARDITERIKNEERIKEISIRDPLTNIYNRRYIFERLEGVISEFLRNGKAFSVSILDIDFFKKINDEYGHIAGDFILKEFAAIISNNLRPYDLFGRYGGEEFIIVSLNSKREQSCSTIERILGLVRGKVFAYNDIEIKFTFSAGISDSPEFEKRRLTTEMIIETADNRLYMAKGSGRNRIVISDLSIADEI